MSAPVDLAGLAERLLGADPARRLICAMAGAPASGKSTMAETLVATLCDREPGAAALLPMDGFHYDDTLLVPMGLRPRKGAPETFDVGGLAATLRRLRARDEAAVCVPVFDRAIEIARAGARLIPREARIVVVEGNWLLLDREPWTGLAPFFDLTVMVRTPESALRARLEARWRRYGLSPEEIVAKIEENDLPNGRLVRDGSRPADLTLAT